MSLTIRPAIEDDAARIADIYNQGIAERSATFETEPRSVDAIAARLRDQHQPWLCQSSAPPAGLAAASHVLAPEPSH
jgi:phosphinothricin acetyltransferase